MHMSVSVQSVAESWSTTGSFQCSHDERNGVHVWSCIIPYLGQADHALHQYRLTLVDPKAERIRHGQVQLILNTGGSSKRRDREKCENARIRNETTRRRVCFQQSARALALRAHRTGRRTAHSPVLFIDGMSTLVYGAGERFERVVNVVPV